MAARRPPRRPALASRAPRVLPRTPGKGNEKWFAAERAVLQGLAASEYRRSWRNLSPVTTWQLVRHVKFDPIWRFTLNELTSRDFTTADDPFALFASLVRGGQKKPSLMIRTLWRLPRSMPMACRMCAWSCSRTPRRPDLFSTAIRRAPRARSFMPICGRRRSFTGNRCGGRFVCAVRSPSSTTRGGCLFRKPSFASPDRRLGKPAIAAARKPVRAGVRRRQICREIWVRRNSAAAPLARLQDCPALSRILVGRSLPSA